MKKIPIIIDCDPGVDDAQAIILALHSPQIDLQAVCSVTGNGSLENTTRNAKDILALCGRRDIPVYRGCGTALDGAAPATVPAFGDDGLGGCAASIASDKEIEKEHAVDYLVRAAAERPGELTLFGIGPCTNIARAVRKDPSFAGNIGRLILMGGAKYTGNMSPVAEYNFWADPLAASEVFRAGFRSIEMIGLDVTNTIAMRADVRELMRIFNTPVSSFLYNAMRDGLDENWQTVRRLAAPMHDVLTVAYLIDETLLTMKDAFIEIVTDGPARGQSLVDVGGRWHGGCCNAKYAESVDAKRFYKLFMTSLFKDHARELDEYFEKHF